MMLDDDYNDSVRNIVHSQEVNVEYAVAAAGDNFARMFAAMDDDYMRERAGDVKDISERLLTVLKENTSEDASDHGSSVTGRIRSWMSSMTHTIQPS